MAFGCVFNSVLSHDDDDDINVTPKPLLTHGMQWEDKVALWIVLILVLAPIIYIAISFIHFCCSAPANFQ